MLMSGRAERVIVHNVQGDASAVGVSGVDETGQRGRPNVEAVDCKIKRRVVAP
jgi:hypothetical protein